MKKIFKVPAVFLMATMLSVFLMVSTFTVQANHANAQERSLVTETTKTQVTQMESFDASLAQTEISAEDQKAIDSLPQVSNDQLFQYLLDSIGGIKGASTLTIAYIIAQAILFFLLSPLFLSVFPKLANDGTKLLIAVAVHLIVGVLGLMLKENLSIGLALTHSTTLASFAVLLDQVRKKIFRKKL